ncbi:MAG: phosphohydrolase [Bacteroidetes bacterium MedPE-SWsnd-G2]|nr:MAG: phosphohydrolase [Bacteroidetes bacterium MedPE-SWsnd-G2]
MEQLIRETEKHVTVLLAESLASHYYYHNLSHTLRVVDAIKVLAVGMSLSAEQTQKLLIAGWFHDTGYTRQCENHELHGTEIAEDFLKKHAVPANVIAEIKSYILATQLDYVPKSLEEKIIRDADCSHFASKNYLAISELLRQEWELSSKKHYTNLEWLNLNISFLTEKHKFHTEFALLNWQSKKEKNLSELIQLIKKEEKNDKRQKVKSEELKLKQDKANIPERGIETMFRVTLKNHITLSNIADTKANIMLSVNSIIVSVVLSNLIPKLDNPSNEYLIIPSIIFISFTILVMILSVWATLPNVTSGKFTKDDVKNRKVNLLFFGNFHKMKLNEFEWAINELMKDREYLYNSMTKDLYFLGKVLDKKYKILRVTYIIFVIGVLISAAAFSYSFSTITIN